LNKKPAQIAKNSYHVFFFAILAISLFKKAYFGIKTK